MKNDSTLLKTPKCVLPNMTSFSRHLGVIARFHHHAAQPSSNATQRTTWGTTAQSRHESNRGQPSTSSIGNLHHESSWWATNIYQPYHTHGHPIQWPFLMVKFPLIIISIPIESPWKKHSPTRNHLPCSRVQGTGIWFRFGFDRSIVLGLWNASERSKVSISGQE